MAATISKTIGAPRTITSVQKYRKVSAVTLYLNDAGEYQITISYNEYELDGSNNTVSSLSDAKVVPNASLNNAAKTEIDNIYTRALGAL